MLDVLRANFCSPLTLAFEYIGFSRNCCPLWLSFGGDVCGCTAVCGRSGP